MECNSSPFGFDIIGIKVVCQETSGSIRSSASKMLPVNKRLGILIANPEVQPLASASFGNQTE